MKAKHCLRPDHQSQVAMAHLMCPCDWTWGAPDSTLILDGSVRVFPDEISIQTGGLSPRKLPCPNTGGHPAHGEPQWDKRQRKEGFAFFFSASLLSSNFSFISSSCPHTGIYTTALLGLRLADHRSWDLSTLGSWEPIFIINTVWLSGLGIIPQSKGSLARFPVMEHAWVAGSVPGQEDMEEATKRVAFIH